MIVCQCESVNDAQVRMAVEVGALSISAIKATTRAGTDCGTCTMTLCSILKAERPDLEVAELTACSECGVPDCPGHAHHEAHEPWLQVVERDIT